MLRDVHEKQRLIRPSTEFSMGIFAFALTLFVVPALALSQTADSKSGNEPQQDSTKELHSGILPPVNYTGDLSSRAFLLGDCGSLRNDLAYKGIRFR